LLHPLLKSAQDNNIRIPEDLSVVVVEYYNNNSISMGNVEFTRVESKAEKVSKLAFKKLLRQVYNRKAGFESCLEHLDLVVGDTTSRPKS
jgi:DNA-binding LacI/PurR family transcriptional regulator